MQIEPCLESSYKLFMTQCYLTRAKMNHENLICATFTRLFRFPVRKVIFRVSELVIKGADSYRMKNNVAGSFIIPWQISVANLDLINIYGVLFLLSKAHFFPQ